jgi:hypothetical protein
MPPTEDHTLVYSLLDLLRPFVLHLFIWLEQLYDTPLGEDDPFFFLFLFLLYAPAPSEKRNDTTKVTVTLDYSQTRRLF